MFRPLHSILVILLGLGWALSAYSQTSDPTDEAESVSAVNDSLVEKAHSTGWQFLGAPYVTADSDNGIIFGGGTGLAHPPHTAYIVNSSISTNGLAGFTWRGETGSDKWRTILLTRIWLLPANLYPEHGALPDPYATARLQHTEFQVAAMRRFTPQFEFGPEIWTDFAKGIEPEDPDGNLLPLSNLPRFEDGSLTLLGLRGRYRTTSAVRPMDGFIIDLALRAGRADGILLDEPRFTATSDLWIGWAKPVTRNTKLYMRGWFRAQDEAVPSVRNALGGIFTLRGQPFNRDYGRRLVAGRFQYHITMARNVTAISNAIQTVLPFMPTWELDLEVAPFADIGAVSDPDWGGWRRTRQGYGVSFRMVLPPELVFFFDLALTPGGDPLFYFGGGESL
ncbi:hypothetical protein KQI63_11555 [bacterium]|nr:hypothetical protein [bacterium]